MLLTFDN